MIKLQLAESRKLLKLYWDLGLQPVELRQFHLLLQLQLERHLVKLLKELVMVVCLVALKVLCLV